VASWPRAGVGLAVALAGLLLRGWAAGYLEKGKRLAQDGPYAWVRHPLYAGSFLMALGFCVAGTGAGRIPSAVLWGVFLFLFVWIYPRRIKQEEESLEKYFGDAWRAFTAGNRRFLPRCSPLRRDKPDAFLWARYLKNREYNAAVGWLAGAAVVIVKGIAGW
jgi:protein-S-isoprenylcysteine O-methyltransferase Ste14